MSAEAPLPSPEECAKEFGAHSEAELIELLIASKCCHESDRPRLAAALKAGLLMELCGCVCSGFYPYRASGSATGSERPSRDLRPADPTES